MGFRWVPQGSERRSSSGAPNGRRDTNETDNHSNELYFHRSSISASYGGELYGQSSDWVPHVAPPARVSSKGCGYILLCMELQDVVASFID